MRAVPSQAQLQAEVTAINALILAIANHKVTSGEWNGRMYRLHNLLDLKKLRDQLETELAGAGVGRQSRQIVPRG